MYWQLVCQFSKQSMQRCSSSLRWKFVHTDKQTDRVQAPYFDNYTQILEKKDNINILAVKVKQHLSENYQNHLKIFTDGSVLETKDAGAAFVIPF